MKRYISMVLVAFLLIICIFVEAPTAYAAGKSNDTRAIAIVFDNSGSMYAADNQAWCRATYAMEVFASMLNAGDTLLIYPMNPFEVNGTEYTMQNPLKIVDASQANLIREIYTPRTGGTHIESIDCAIAGAQQVQADHRYVIVVSDGDVFYRNGKELSQNESKSQLSAYFEQASNDMIMMYLGISKVALMPDTEESDVFAKKHAKNSADVLSALTDMCNRVFGRDILPKDRISGNTINFDVSMKKLIVFVQGDNIADLKLTDGSGNLAGEEERVQEARYSTMGCGAYNSNPDKSLQGMMVTYKDCAAGTYNIEYTGTATSVEVYYEPDADLDFVFTDAAGFNINPQALFEGEYKVSFGMKDAKTRELISSDLLGNPKYRGSYFIDGQEYPFTHEGFSGSVNVPLKMGERFEATLTVTYLSGYSITKDSSDFGWPDGGIQIAPKSAGEFRLEITGGDNIYSLQDLKEGSPYIAKVYYQGILLTGSDLEKVDLKWEPETSNAEIKKEFAEDHWKLFLHYKDPAEPQNTACGECTVTIYAFYSAKGSSEANAECPLTYNIRDDFSLVQLDLFAPETYIVIGQLEESKPFTVNLKLNGAPFGAEDFANVKLQADCDGIANKVTANVQDSSYQIKLLPTEGITDGDYQIKVTAVYTDHIGREVAVDDAVTVTLSGTPLWLRWTIRIVLLLILLIAIWLIMHIKVLPTKAHTSKKLSNFNFDGEDETKSANFLAEIKKGGTRMQTQYGGRKFGIMMEAVPGPNAFLYLPDKKKSAQVLPGTVRKFGPAKIQEALIGTAKYKLDEDTGKLVPALPNQKPFLLKNGATVRYSGTISDAGIDKDFEVLSKISFTKK